jgi:hypothetical protein
VISDERIKELAKAAANMYDCCAFANPHWVEDAIREALVEDRRDAAPRSPAEK